jgi:catechol 2,3-dioxygenase-like lactoylglutathione lyase family enzyme
MRHTKGGFREIGDCLNPGAVYGIIQSICNHPVMTGGNHLKGRRLGMAYTLDHLHMVCRNLEQVIEFFTGNFEAQLVGIKKFEGVNGATINLGGFKINLRALKENEELAEAGRGVHGYHHIGIGVDDLDTEYERLSGKGYQFSVPPKKVDDTLRIAFFEGPENLIVELLEKTA